MYTIISGHNHSVQRHAVHKCLVACWLMDTIRVLHQSQLVDGIVKMLNQFTFNVTSA